MRSNDKTTNESEFELLPGLCSVFLFSDWMVKSDVDRTRNESELDFGLETDKGAGLSVFLEGGVRKSKPGIGSSYKGVGVVSVGFPDLRGVGEVCVDSFSGNTLSISLTSAVVTSQ